MTVRAVLFDLDGTLYDRDELVRKVAIRQYDAFQNELSPVSKDVFIKRLLELDAYGHGDKPKLYATLVGEWGLAPELTCRLVESFWSLYEQGCELSEDTRLTLQTLRKRGLKLGVITNGQVEWQQRKLDTLGIAEWFDAILISEAEGVRKPDPEIFRRALTRCDVEASEALFVGDNPDADVGGAMQAGLRAVWRVVPYWSCAHDVPRISQLSEVLAMCENTKAPVSTVISAIVRPRAILL